MEAEVVKIVIVATYPFETIQIIKWPLAVNMSLALVEHHFISNVSRLYKTQIKS